MEMDQDSFFDKRWDSLQNKNIINSSYQTQRPPGWDDVQKCTKVKKYEKSSFCPSVVIKEHGRTVPANHRIPAPPACRRLRAMTQHTHYRSGHQGNSLNMKGSSLVHPVFSDNVLQVLVQDISSSFSLASGTSFTSRCPQLSASTSNVAELSTCTLPQQVSSTTDTILQRFSTSDVSQPLSCTPHTAQQSSTFGVTRQHSSSPHLAQQSFSTSDVTPQLSTPHVAQQSSSNSDVTQQHPSTAYEVQQASFPSSGTQLSTSNMIQQPASTCSVAQESGPGVSDRHMWLSSERFFSEAFTFSSDTSCQDADAAEHSEPSPKPQPCCSWALETSLSKEKTAQEESHVSSTEEEDKIRLSTSPSLCRKKGNTHRPTSPSYSSQPAVNSETRTLRVADVPPRQHWVHLDGSATDWWTPTTAARRETVPTKPDGGSTSGAIPFQRYQSATAPSLVILGQPRASPTHASSYSGSLLRTYSQRGYRASKRVINSVSRRMNVSDYGRLPESQQPMYSKAAMTMQSSPGLFEKTPHRAKSQCLQEGEKPSMSREEPDSPRRAGPMRAAPRLSSALLQRSVSLNTPTEEYSDMALQSLSEQRPGSFRRALGALTRSFRRKSKSTNTPDDNTFTNQSVTVIATNGKQPPKAPRLPRRAARQQLTHT